MTDLLTKQTVHDEEHKPLQAPKECEQVRHGCGTLHKLETFKGPRSAQHT